MCGFLMPGQPGFNAIFPGVSKLMAEAKADSSAAGTKSGTRQTSPSGNKGADRRGGLIGGGNNPSVKGKAGGKVEGRRQTGPSASGFKGTDKRGDLVSGDRKKSAEKKTLLGG
jgi:hypothetical protein